MYEIFSFSTRQVGKSFIAYYWREGLCEMDIRHSTAGGGAVPGDLALTEVSAIYLGD